MTRCLTRYLVRVFSILSLTLTACTNTVGPVVATRQPNQYAVTHRAGNPLVSWVELKSTALNQAQHYCQALGKKMTQPKLTSNHATGLIRPMTTVTFTCTPIDPKH